jgi:hypothetical protein
MVTPFRDDRVGDHQRPRPEHFVSFFGDPAPHFPPVPRALVDELLQRLRNR